VIEASDPERIVGMAALREAENRLDGVKQIEGVLRFAWEVRPSWFNHPAVEALLESVVNESRESGAKGLIISAENEGFDEKILLGRGFEEVSRKQIWNIGVDLALDQLLAKFSRMLLRAPVEITHADVANLEPIRKICTHYKLLSPQSVVPLSLLAPTGFDPRLSFVAGSPSHPFAILLGREAKGKAYLDILARNAEYDHESPVASLGLLREFFLAAKKIGYEKSSCMLLFEQDSGIVSLLRRLGATREEAVSQLVLTF
jgi:hypothetical protein